MADQYELDIDVVLDMLLEASETGTLSNDRVVLRAWREPTPTPDPRSSDPVIYDAALSASYDLVMFMDDEDLRAKDPDYDRDFREVLRAQREYLLAVLRGEDPRHRRAPWWKRTLWRLGLYRFPPASN